MTWNRIYTEKKVASNNFLQIVINTLCQMLSIFGNTSRCFLGLRSPDLLFAHQVDRSFSSHYARRSDFSSFKHHGGLPPILRCSLTVSPLMPMLLQPFWNFELPTLWDAMSCFDVFDLSCASWLCFFWCVSFSLPLCLSAWKVLSE